MKIATYRVSGERRVGLVDVARQTVAPFDLPEAEAAQGVLALIDRSALPRILSPMPLAEAILEAPIPRPRRNIYCVGKNYHEHAKEFAASGFDSSAANGAVPKHPIIFSKVPECVIAHRDRVAIDNNVSQAVDYEAELGVIIGKGGRGIKPADALDHVWGYTIINDVTARDLQGRYSQWLIGKSQDTFCPMGPWAVTRDEIDLADTKIQCWINGELRQDANTRDLIFDIPTIIATISAGVTLMPGDVIASGTPAGVGIGFKPPRYVVPGDVARIEIAGIGVLENEFRDMPRMSGAAVGRIMIEIDGEGPAVVFVPGLGATSNSFQTLLGALGGFRCIRVDLPGSGRSPRPYETLSIEGFVTAVADVCKAVAGGPAHLVGHSMGALVCQHLAASVTELVKSLTLFGPVVEPGDAARQRLKDRARAARHDGMIGIADAAVAGGVSPTSRNANPLLSAFLRESHMRQDPESFAQACEALAAAHASDLRSLRCPTLIVTGDEDAIAPPSAAQALADKLKGAKLKVLEHCGHWTMLERPQDCARLLSEHLRAQAA